MRYFALFFAFVFAVFAAFQYNDSDPWLWIPIYLFATVLSWLAYRGRYTIPLLAIGAVAYLIGAIYYFPPSVGNWIHAEETAQSLQMKMPFVEEAREAMGLGICFVVLAVYLWAAIRRRNHRKHIATQPHPEHQYKI